LPKSPKNDCQNLLKCFLYIIEINVGICPAMLPLAHIIE
jgi:hypothetical protein